MNKNNSTSKYLLNILSVLIFIIFVVFELYINMPNIFSIFSTNTSFENANVLMTEKITDKATISIVNINKVDIDNIYKEVDESYFNNTLFIGDSRTVGFKVYKSLTGATYYCSKTFGVYGGFDRTMEIDNYGLMTLEELLKANQFSKIYICLGINNAPTNPITHEEKYRNFVNKIREMQPSAIIYLIANLHVTKYYDEDSRVNNTKIDTVNSFIKNIADNKTIFYLDPNFLYDNDEGALDYIYSADDMHIKVMYYDKLLDFLKKHAIDTEKLKN